MALKKIAPVEYVQATLSWCPDLTDPDAKPEPIGVVLVAQHGASRSVVIVTRQPSGANTLDLLTRSIITEAPMNVARAVRTVTEELGQTASLEAVLDAAQGAVSGNVSMTTRWPTASKYIQPGMTTSGLFEIATAALSGMRPSTEKPSFSKLFQLIDHR